MRRMKKGKRQERYLWVNLHVVSEAGDNDNMISELGDPMMNHMTAGDGTRKKRSVKISTSGLISM